MMHLAITFFLLAASIQAMEHENCKKITCGSKTSATGACVEVSETKVVLNTCPDGYICDSLDQFRTYYDHENGTCNSTTPVSTIPSCPSHHENQLPTFFYCCQASDCASNLCNTTTHKCIGKALGETCDDDESCGAGLYCNNYTSGICVKTKKDGEKCTDDNECNAGSGCYEILNVCLQFFSLNDGEKTRYDDYCKSGTMEDDKCDSVIIKVEGNITEEPWACNIGDKCTYTWSIANTQAEEADYCECDGKGSYTGYCPIRYLQAIKNFTDDFYEKFQYNSSDCSGDSAHLTWFGYKDVVYCNSIDEDKYDYFHSMWEIKRSWSLYVSGQIDDCAKDMLLFDPSEDYDSLGSAEFVVLSALLILFN